jgi:hypothetical protein
MGPHFLGEVTMSALRKAVGVAFPAALLLALGVEQAAAQYRQAPAPAPAPNAPQYRQVPAPMPTPMPPGAYYSWRMQASFVVQPIDLSPYGWPGYRPVAQLVSMPLPFSPLSRIGLTPGDMITRLDDIPIRTYADLDNHYTLTKITFIRQGTYYAQQAWVDLGPLYPGAATPFNPGAEAPVYPSRVAPTTVGFISPVYVKTRWGR